MMPSSIGPYRIVGQLGRGGMGVVYRGEHSSTGEAVAIKTVPVPHQGDLAGLRLEIHALSQIQHPGVVRIVDQGVETGLPWYAMELLSGTSLKDVLERRIWSDYPAILTFRASTTRRVEEDPPRMERSAAGAEAQSAPPEGAEEVGEGELPPAAGGQLTEVLALVRRLCDVLGFIHSRGIVHRDLKPENVFVRPDGTPVLIDFGLVARAYGSVGRETLEVPEALVGTVGYVAPEQILGQRVDPRADLYALGCMIYELVTGRLPFMARTHREILERHLWTRPPRLSQLVTGAPPLLEQLVLGLLEKRPRDRIGHADDVAAALEALGVPKAAEAQSPATPYLYRPELVGRDTVVTELRRLLRKLPSGGGGVVLLVGESGIGKTYVASEAARLALGEGLQVVTGECQPRGSAEAAQEEPTGAPLHPFGRLLQAIGDRCRQHGAEETQRLLGERCRLLVAYEPSLAHLPGYEDYPEPELLDGEEARRRVFEALAETLTAWAADQPLLLILDDLQWADEMSLAFLASLPPDYFAKARILLLGTHRVEEESQAALGALAAQTGASRIELGRLSEPMVGMLVGHMLAIVQPPVPLVRSLTRQTGGNPFFVAEYLRAAVAEGLLYRAAGRWQVMETEADYERLLPHSLRDLIERRLGALAPSTRTLLQAAAVLGREFEVELLPLVAEVSERALLEALRELRTRQILEPSGAGRYRFAHDKLREFAYAQVPEEKRRALHRAAAITIEHRYAASDRFPLRYRALAHHLKHAELWERAVFYLEKAGEQAIRDFSNHEAVDLYQQALGLVDRMPGGVAPELLARWERALTEAHFGLGQVDRGRHHADRALRHCGTPLPSSPLAWWLGFLGQCLQRMLSGLLIITGWRGWWRRRRAPAPRPLLAEAAQVLSRLMENFFLANDPLAGIYCGLRCLNLGQRLPPSAAVARCYAFMTTVAGLLPLQGVARAWVRRAIEIAEQIDSDATRVYCLNRVGCYLIGVGAWDEANNRLEAALGIVQRIGDRRQEEEGLAIYAIGLHCQGRFAESVAAGREVLALAEERGDPQTLCWARNLLAQSLARNQRMDEAQRLVAAGRDWVERMGGEAEKIMTYGTAVLVCCEANDWQEAEAYAARALECMRRQNPVQYFLQSSIAAVADLYLMRWEQERSADEKRRRMLMARAREACRLLRRFAQLMPFSRPAYLISDGLERWLAGHERAACERWQRALERARELAMPFEEARAHLELGRHIQGEEGKRHLARAHRLFELLHATGEAARVRSAQAQMEG